MTTNTQNRFEDYSDLPKEVLDQIIFFSPKPISSRILNLLREGPLDIDQILIGLYRTYGYIGKRKIIQNTICILAYRKKIERKSKYVYGLIEKS